MEVVQEKKAKFGVRTKQKEKSDDKALMYGLVNYKPAKPESEDTESSVRHVTWLQDAYKSRTKSDMDKVNNLMDLTLYLRREEILRGANIKDVLKKYPWLQKSGENIHMEFERISKISIDMNVSQFLNDHGNAIIELVVSKNPDNRIIQSLLSQRGTDNDKYAASCVAVMGLAFLLKEDVASLVGQLKDIPEPEVAPVFIGFHDNQTPDRFVDLTTFFVYVEGVEVCECGDFIEAFQIYLCCFSIFNLSYKSLMKTMSFVEKVVLKLTGEPQKKVSKEEKSVITLISLLNTERQKKTKPKQAVPKHVGKDKKRAKGKKM